MVNNDRKGKVRWSNVSPNWRVVYVCIRFVRMGTRDRATCGKQSWTERHARIDHSQSGSDNRNGALGRFCVPP
jgi:hypothetical protein